MDKYKDYIGLKTTHKVGKGIFVGFIYNLSRFLAEIAYRKIFYLDS